MKATRALEVLGVLLIGCALFCAVLKLTVMKHRTILPTISGLLLLVAGKLGRNYFPLLPTGLASYEPKLFPLVSERQRFSIIMSRVTTKPVFGNSDKVRHKPTCTTTEDGNVHDISDLGRSYVAQIIQRRRSAARIRFCIYAKTGFLMTWLIYTSWRPAIITCMKWYVYHVTKADVKKNLVMLFMLNLVFLFFFSPYRSLRHAG